MSTSAFADDACQRNWERHTAKRFDYLRMAAIEAAKLVAYHYSQRRRAICPECVGYCDAQTIDAVREVGVQVPPGVI